MPLPSRDGTHHSVKHIAIVASEIALGHWASLLDEEFPLVLPPIYPFPIFQRIGLAQASDNARTGMVANDDSPLLRD